LKVGFELFITFGNNVMASVVAIVGLV